MVVLNRIYTRTGDDVTTALGTGALVAEYDAWSGRRAFWQLAPDQEADVLLRREVPEATQVRR